MEDTVSAFEKLGGREPIARLVERFYAIMDSDPVYAALRAMHGPDLAPMARSLTGFLVAATGGPRDWFEQRPGACIMSAHNGLAGMGRETAEQWIDVMRRALDNCAPGDPALRDDLLAAMAQMCHAMAARADGMTVRQGETAAS